jgi:phage terminase small subunit
MKSLLLSLLLTPAIAMAADTAAPKKPGKGGDKRPTPEEAFKKLDANADGTVSLEEFKASPRGKKDATKAEEAFKKMDKDSDGKLTLDEFKARAAKKEGTKPDAPKPDAPKPETPKTEAPKTAEPK